MPVHKIYPVYLLSSNYLHELMQQLEGSCPILSKPSRWVAPKICSSEELRCAWRTELLLYTQVACKSGQWDLRTNLLYGHIGADAAAVSVFHKEKWCSSWMFCACYRNSYPPPVPTSIAQFRRSMQYSPNCHCEVVFLVHMLRNSYRLLLSFGVLGITYYIRKHAQHFRIP